MISVNFSGSKIYCYKAVKEIAQNGAYSSVFEPFGGSCVLSVNLFNDGVVKRAVANDYDHFFDSYEEYLDLKDLVVSECYSHGLKKTTHSKKGNFRIEPDGTRNKVKSRMLNAEDRRILQKIIGKNVPKRFWRYFSLGNNFTHSIVHTHNKIKLSDFSMFNANLQTDKQRNYLKALRRIEIEHLDWRDFIKKHQSSINSESLLVLDPPYVNTSQEQYSGQFTESDTIELIKEAAKLGCDFLFFNHDPEKVKEWLEGFDYDLTLIKAKTAAHQRRLDVMAYVRRTERPGQISFVESELSKGANNGV